MHFKKRITSNAINLFILYQDLQLQGSLLKFFLNF